MRLEKWKLQFLAIGYGESLSLVGSGIVQFALIWWITKYDGSASALTMAAFMALAPSIVIGPFAGTLAGRLKGKYVLVISAGAGALLSLLSAILITSNQAQVWHIDLLILGRSLASAVCKQVMLVSLSQIVPQKNQARVTALNQALLGTGIVILPAVSAILLAFLTVAQVMLIDCLTFGPFAAAILFANIPSGQRCRPAVTQTFRANLRAGLGFVTQHRLLKVMCLQTVILNALLTPALVLLPILVTRVYRGDVLHLGSLQVAAGIGLALGGLVFGFVRMPLSRIKLSQIGLIGWGIGTVCVGAIPAVISNRQDRFLLAVAAMFVIGVTHVLNNAPLAAAQQAVIPPELSGRVFTLIDTAVNVGTPIGLYFVGAAGDVIGPASIWMGAGLMGIFTAVITLFIPDYMNFGTAELARTEPIHHRPQALA